MLTQLAEWSTFVLLALFLGRWTLVGSASENDDSYSLIGAVEILLLACFLWVVFVVFLIKLVSRWPRLRIIDSLIEGPLKRPSCTENSG